MRFHSRKPIVGKQPVIIAYDGECPFCRNYVRLLDLRINFDPVLIDVRENSAMRREYGHIDFDEGMLVVLDGDEYFGHEAVHLLSLLSDSSSTFNKVNRALFRHRRRSKMLYSIMKLGRRVTLRVLGVGSIKNA